MSTGSRDVSAVYELLYNPNYTPRKSTSSHIDQLTVDGEPAYVLINESEAEYYDVDPSTNTVWEFIDGKRTVKEILERAKQSDESLTEKGVKDTIISLAEAGAIESTEQEVQKRRVETPSAFELDVHLVDDSSKALAGFFRVTRRLIKRWELPAAIAIAAVGFVFYAGTFVRIFGDPSAFNVAGSAVLGFFLYQMVLLLPVYAVHELAHAAMCDYFGGKPHEIGTGLYYLAPFFYCDTSDAWRLSRRARMMISLAGPLSTVVISSFFVFWSLFLSPGTLQNVLQVAAFFGYYGSLINFSPVIETDGYYILADALNVPNLRDEAFSFVKRTFLRLFRRPVKAVRQSARRRRTIAIYSVITVAWLAFFAYTTLWVMYVYGSAAYSATLGLGSVVLRTAAFDLTAVSVNVATLGYFGLYLIGFVVMGVVASRNIRMKGVRLETIHDKRVSAFLPVPSFMKRSKASELVRDCRRLARNYSRSFSVTLEPPFCVVALKLGKVDQSLDAMRSEMQGVERAFRSVHSDFLSKNPVSGDASSAKQAIGERLLALADQFPKQERKAASLAASNLLKMQDRAVATLLESAYGTVWTLEVSPEDYRRIRREMFPSLVSEDLGLTDMSSDLEAFKKHVVLGPEAMAQLSSEVEEESKEVYRRPEVFQVTALIEPMKSRLVFIGRTNKVEGSVVWLGGLFLYQAWTKYIGGILDDAALGLKSIRLAPAATLTKSQASGLSGPELDRLGNNFDGMDSLTNGVEEAITKIESTFESAINFHETLDSLISDETFDIGLYKPILTANAKHLEGVKDKIDAFGEEFRKLAKKLSASASVLKEERARRESTGASEKQSWSGKVIKSLSPSNWFGGARVDVTIYNSEVKLAFATFRLIYPVLLASDIIL